MGYLIAFWDIAAPAVWVAVLTVAAILTMGGILASILRCCGTSAREQQARRAKLKKAKANKIQLAKARAAKAAKASQRASAAKQ